MFLETPHLNFRKCFEYAKDLPNLPGFYVLCFPDINPDSTSNLGHASHYLGKASSIRFRFIRHMQGRGGNIVRVQNARNGDIVPACHYLILPNVSIAGEMETWAKKKIKSPRRFCPECSHMPVRLPKRFLKAHLEAKKVFNQ